MKAIIIFLNVLAITGIFAECEFDSQHMKQLTIDFVKQAPKCEIGHFKEELQKLRDAYKEFESGIADECWETEVGQKYKERFAYWVPIRDFMETFDQETKDNFFNKKNQKCLKKIKEDLSNCDGIENNEGVCDFCNELVDNTFLTNMRKLVDEKCVHSHENHHHSKENHHHHSKESGSHENHEKEHSSGEHDSHSHSESDEHKGHTGQSIEHKEHAGHSKHHGHHRRHHHVHPEGIMKVAEAGFKFSKEHGLCGSEHMVYRLNGFIY